ncbi:SCY1-like protein 2 [Vitis vinifera]|uniref:SCY1-like protein 2 n=1 Tax=Vitis vinifera TaxID=29760 RepID=A0A438FH17_VITVI|nr:SCY1-like protein 2 [Vitis vinifera]
MGQGYEDHLVTQEADIPEVDRVQWRKIDAQLCSVLWQSVDPRILLHLQAYKTCFKFWTQAKGLYTNDIQRLYKVASAIVHISQQDLDLSTYIGQIASLKEEFLTVMPLTPDVGAQQTQLDKFFMVLTLIGLRPDLEPIRDQILGSSSVPSLDDVFARLLRISSTQTLPSDSTSDSSVLVSQTTSRGGRSGTRGRGQRPHCTYCNKLGHTRDRCYQLHGRPPRTAHMAQSSDSPLPQPPSSSASQTSQASIASVAQPGNASACLTHTSSLGPWILDSGASDHLSGNKDLFSSITTTSDLPTVTLANGSQTVAKGIGLALPLPSLPLTSVLYTPECPFNLISISKITRTLNCSITFSDKFVTLQDRSTGKTIGIGRESQGLYHLTSIHLLQFAFPLMLLSSFTIVWATLVSPSSRRWFLVFPLCRRFRTSHEHLVSHVLPLLVRAYDDNDARIQEEVLRRSAFLAKQLDAQLVKQAILPRVHGLALKTTVAAVRVNALLCLSDLVSTLDKHAVLDVLQTVQRCTAVDRSPPTLMSHCSSVSMCVVQYGIEFAAEHVLPLLTPLLIAQQLNVQQFAKYMLFVKDILRKIEEKRGVTLTDSGMPQSSTSWDEDWGPTTKAPANSIQPSTISISSTLPYPSNQPIEVASMQPHSSLTSASSQHTASTCPPVDIEWPPRASSGMIPKLGDAANQKPNTGSPSTSTFDDIDPFADWPPRPGGSLNVSGSSNNGIVASSNNKYGTSSSSGAMNDVIFQTNSDMSWAFNTQKLVEPSRQNQGNSTFNSTSLNSGLNSQSSIGKNDHAAPRLAPPPPTAVGRGRGRGRGNQGHSNARPAHAKSPSEQPPLLDLL